jgi:hypothetical protein
VADVEQARGRLDKGGEAVAAVLETVAVLRAVRRAHPGAHRASRS